MFSLSARQRPPKGMIHMSKNLSHAACQHPSTKVARAACRRAMKKAATAIPNPILAAVEAALQGPKMLTAGIAAEPVTIATEITRENWREFKGQPAIVLTNDDEPTTRGMITGWSANLLQIKTDAKLVRIPVGNVVTVVTDNA